MSDNEGEQNLYGKKWVVAYAQNGLSICKDLHCLNGDKKIAKGCLRLGRRYPSPFDKDSIAINWFHAKCMFNQQKRSRIGTQVIGSFDDIDGMENILLADRDLLGELIEGNIELIPIRTSPSSTTENSKPESTRTADPKQSKKRVADGNKDRRISINRRDAGRVLMM
jgi:hypothetical protein